MQTLKNHVHLIGHLGQDPEILTLESGRKRARFSLATNEDYKNSEGEKITDTQWHSIIAWGRTAEIIEEYLIKGAQIAVSGRLAYRSYEDKEGIKRYGTEVICNEILMLQSKPV